MCIRDSFGTMLLLLLMWLCLDGPLVVCGAWMGFKAPQWEEPVFTNAIPRQIPSQPLLATPLATALLGGLLPFGSASIELAIVVSSVWMQRIYFVFGFLLLMVLMMALICAEVGIVMAYLQLCREDYRCGGAPSRTPPPPAATSSSTRSCTRGRISSSTAPRRPCSTTGTWAPPRSASR